MKLAIVLLLIPTLVWAEVDITFKRPSRVMLSAPSDFTSYEMPIGPFSGGEIQTVIAEGAGLRKTWRVRLNGDGTLDLMDALRRQIEARGFELLYECETEICGGFDFRFNTEVVQEPDMHIDLGDFRYLAAQRLGGENPEYLSFLVSRSNDRGYIQMTSVGSTTPEKLSPDGGIEPSDVEPVTGDTLISVLEATGSVALDDLDFASGSSQLGAGDYATLRALAGYLVANPENKIVLAGHTDAVGALQSNIALSRARARSVMLRLTQAYDVPASQVSASGIGYLAPRSPNTTEEGRARNRRVEAVLLAATP